MSNIKIRMVAVILLPVSLMAACTTTPPRQHSDEDRKTMAQVVVYSKSQSAYARGIGMLGFAGVAVYVDDQHICTVRDGKFARIFVTPGAHIIKGKISLYGVNAFTVNTFSYDLSPGDIRYIHYEDGSGKTAGYPYVDHDMSEVDAQVGPGAILDLKEVACEI